MKCNYTYLARTDYSITPVHKQIFYPELNEPQLSYWSLLWIIPLAIIFFSVGAFSIWFFWHFPHQLIWFVIYSPFILIGLIMHTK